MPGAFVDENASPEQIKSLLRKKLSKPTRRSSLSVSKTIHYDSEGNEDEPEANDKTAESPRETTPAPAPFPLCLSCKQRSQLDSPVIVTTTPPGTAASSPHSAKRRRSSCREALVGSYEESLLSGRMSTSSSAPVQFHARIGVLGKGKYAQHCPRHLTVPFDAVFYDWRASSVGASESSPYTGCVDLEAAYADRKDGKFRGYKIPKQGQIQIIVSNSQKTAVQLYLVPYDLRKMPENTKTFLRQKTYQQNPRSLVQAIHIQVACPPLGKQGKQRLYIYGDIRLAFQNRVALSWNSHTGKNGQEEDKQEEDSKSGSQKTTAVPSSSGSTGAKDTKAEIVAGGFNVFVSGRDRSSSENQSVEVSRCSECDGSLNGEGTAMDED
jgi:Domain of unknown function (DUF4210)/Chromosome segregation during meiosis